LTPGLAAWLKTNTAWGYLKTVNAEQEELLSLELRRGEIEGKNLIHLFKGARQNRARYYKLLLTEEGKINWLLDEPGFYNERKASALFATFIKNQSWRCPTLVGL
jgi:hypothetical protein